MVKTKTQINYEKLLEEISPKFKNKINFYELETINSYIKKSKYIHNKLKELSGMLRLSSNAYSRTYWIYRGWNEEESYVRTEQQKIKFPKRKQISPFSKKFWMMKGMTEEEADYKRNSMRPIKKEFWMMKGMTEEEAIKKAMQTKQKNDNNGKIVKWKLKYKCKRCKEYWMLNEGMTEEEAIKAVSEYQLHFNLEICIEKHGEIEGRRIWQDRQDRWQATLKSKTQEEIDDINRRKAIDYDGMTELERSEIFLKQFFTKNNIDRKKLSKKDIKNIIIELYEKENFGKKLLKKIDKTKTYYYLSIVYDIELEKLIEENINFSNDVKQNKWGIYTQYDNITGKLLRSSLEIVFCELLKKHNIKYEIGIQYPNSRMFCDFYLPEIDQWIEIAGMMADEKYRQKMKFKQKTFGSVILEPKDINNYFKGLL